MGKNESGKTTFLQALYRLKPARPNVNFSVPDQYPAWLEKRHRQEGKDLDDVCPVTAVFELSDEDHKTLAAKFGKGAVTSKQITVQRSYDGDGTYTFETNEKAAVQYVISTTGIKGGPAAELKKVETFEGLVELAAKWSADADPETQTGGTRGSRESHAKSRRLSQECHGFHCRASPNLLLLF